ncbi:phospholipid phosphatase 3-like [Dermatophagoides pteronyssinus]|uniref:Phospholipid phosphatase 3-like n=1 Tax=Dermatophagoides pteronyssinus TaxID=6956 RepID=A0A6P6YJB8_DERPT|nr:phospholipid phosphatase 3-like [Dermatophagoides pteronyssinus]
MININEQRQQQQQQQQKQTETNDKEENIRNRITKTTAIDNNDINIVELKSENIDHRHRHRNRNTMQYLPRIIAIPNRSQLLIRILIDSSVLISISIPILLLCTMGKPYKRGFYCDDDSIRYPFIDSTIPSNILLLYSILIPVLTICINEFLIYRKFMSGFDLSSRYFLKNYLWQLYIHLIPFAFAFLGSQLITDIAKYSIGRLRPHFIDACHPKDDKGFVYDRFSTCSTPDVYVTDYNCTKNKNDNYRLKDSRLSFMSGHSSFSAVTLMYLVYYIQFRFQWRNIGLFKPLYQYLLICLIFYTGFTRISDYKHHWSDVLVGIIQGTIVATICAFFVSDLKTIRSSSSMSIRNNNQHNNNDRPNNIIIQSASSMDERTNPLDDDDDGGIISDKTTLRHDDDPESNF